MRPGGGSLACLIGLSLLAAPRVLSCAVEHVRTALEITRDAEAIVLARAVGSTRGGGLHGTVTFETMEVLKGVAPAGHFDLEGETDTYEGPNPAKPPYNFVRPGGRGGNCCAFDYKLGGEFLLFLRNGTTAWSPLAATNEEVSDPTDPWVLWVKDRLAGLRTGPEAREPSAHGAYVPTSREDSLVVGFVSAGWNHGIDYEYAHALGEPALHVLESLIDDDSRKDTWENAVATVGAIGSERGVPILQRFMRGRFRGQVDDTTFRALRNVPDALGLISNAGVPAATRLLEQGTNPACWDSLPWSDRFYSKTGLASFLATIYVVGLSYTGSDSAGAFLARLARTPYVPRQKPVATEALRRNSEIRKLGLTEWGRRERRKRGWAPR